MPCVAAVGRFEKTACLSLPCSVFPWPLASSPHIGVECLPISRVELDLHGARVLVDVKRLLKRASAVGRAVNAAFLIWTVRMTENGDEQPIFIFWIDRDRRD